MVAHAKVILPEMKFDGTEKVPIRQYLAQLNLYVDLKEWSNAINSSQVPGSIPHR